MFTYFLKSGCAIFVSTLFCDIVKGPNTIAIIIASALHLSLCIERIVASYYGLESYDLNANFSASESQNAYTVLWPFSALHLFAQLTFLLLSAYLPMLLDLKSFSVDDLLTIAALIYVYNAYIVAACLAMLQILKRIRKERKNKIQIAVRDGNDPKICHEIYSLNW
ncbi:unnamed protein product, partial [Mesorhabditis belari]|uniref:Uncharacterized protein n=1 Tax=Mesorhabditis belari TaxID=2138241 RepID=A0AAF3ETJ4_9BILA